MTEGGYIIIARRIFEHPLLQDSDYFRAWVWLLSEAAWRPRRVRITNGRASEIIEIGRGQLTHSRSYMARAWRWSEKRVRTFLNRLKSDGMIDTQAGPHQTIITICNYDVYQIAADAEGRQTGQQTGRQRASKGPEKEELKERKNRYTVSGTAKNPKLWPADGFIRWYALYPRKRSRGAAEASFAQAQTRGEVTFDELLAATRRFAESMGDKDPKFTPYPATWLAAKGYLDEPDKPKGAGDLKIAEPLRSPQSFTEEDWKDRLRNCWAKGEWSGHWGPRPGELGCRVPAYLLNGGSHA
jgi:hypothetical protein